LIGLIIFILVFAIIGGLGCYYYFRKLKKAEAFINYELSDIKNMESLTGVNISLTNIE
jgi:uncharacterized protein (DUF2164 family)